MMNDSRNPLRTMSECVRNPKGFTILELVVVIAVFAVLAVIAVPSMEALVYGSGSNRATLELISDLQQARMTAIRTHQTITVTFNDPGQDQYRILDVNLVPIRTEDISAGNSRIAFDPAPPGGAPAPNASFEFSPLGLIRTDLGTATGNIYIVDNRNGRRFCISTTVAGGIIERQWDGSNWSGPVLTI